jgi:hypothetical protein
LFHCAPPLPVPSSQDANPDRKKDGRGISLKVFHEQHVTLLDYDWAIRRTEPSEAVTVAEQPTVDRPMGVMDISYRSCYFTTIMTMPLTPP